jgi:hypothetical protein
MTQIGTVVTGVCETIQIKKQEKMDFVSNIAMNFRPVKLNLYYLWGKHRVLVVIRFKIHVFVDLKVGRFAGQLIGVAVIQVLKHNLKPPVVGKDEGLEEKKGEERNRFMLK